MTTPQNPGLTFLATIDVAVGQPIEVGETAEGHRRIIPIIGGTVQGPALNGKVLPAGADFQVLAANVVYKDTGGTIFPPYAIHKFNGIKVGADTGQSGFNDVKITNSIVEKNQHAGVNFEGDFDQADRSAHTNVLISHVRAFDTTGRANRPHQGNTGSGIVIGQVNGGVIQYSVAKNNGKQCASDAGGPRPKNTRSWRAARPISSRPSNTSKAPPSTSSTQFCMTQSIISSPAQLRATRYPGGTACPRTKCRRQRDTRGPGPRRRYRRSR